MMTGELMPRQSGLASEKIRREHRERLAVVYVRQSTVQQIERHQESTRLQYALVDRAFPAVLNRAEALIAPWLRSDRRRSSEGQRCQKVGGEDQEGGDGSQVFEEPAAGSHLLHRLAPEIFGQIADGMEGESEQVQGDEHGGKIGFPVPEVVFEMVAVIL